MKCKCRQQWTLMVSHSRLSDGVWDATVNMSCCLFVYGSESLQLRLSFTHLSTLPDQTGLPSAALTAHLSHNHFVKSHLESAQFDRLLLHRDTCAAATTTKWLYTWWRMVALMQVVPNRRFTCSKRANLSVGRVNQSMMPIIVTTTCGALSLRFTASLTIWLIMVTVNVCIIFLWDS